jgi:excisionase family DNA binding protein
VSSQNLGHSPTTEKYNENRQPKIELVENDMSVDDLVTITEAAMKHNVTRQAIYVAIKQRKLKAYRRTSRWMISLDDLNNYRGSRYSRSKSVHNGELIFDQDKGYYSVNQVASMLNVPRQKIYYALRSGFIKAVQKGSAWVIHKDEVENYRSTYLDKKMRKAI